MPTAKLTKRFIDTVAADGTEAEFYDTELPGFYLRVTKAGIKTYAIRYRNLSRQQRRFAIGSHGTLTVDQARAQARQLLAGVERGDDPAAASAAYREAWSVAELASAYREAHFPSLREKTRADYAAQIDRFIIPRLGRRKVAEVTTPDVKRFHHDISTSGKTQANRVVRCLSSMFTVAVEQGRCTVNPCKGVRLHTETKRERFLSEAELARLFAACDAHPNRHAANFVKLLALTGARKGEMLSAAWSEFDLDRGVWTKPSHHTKQKRTHSVALTSAAVQLLTSMRDDADPRCMWVFPGLDATKPLQEPKRPVAQIIEAAGMTAGLQDVTLHTLRHTHASLLVSAGVSLQVAGKMLGHTSIATTQRYAHLTDSAQAEAAAKFDSIATKAQAVAHEHRKAEAAKVVSIKQARRSGT